MLIFSYYNIYWHFPNHRFCSRIAPYQWWGIVKQSPMRRISTRVFSMFSKTLDFHDFGAQGPWAHGTLMPKGIFRPINDKTEMEVFMIFNLCHLMQNVGQTIYVAGPFFLRMVLAVILAVVVYSIQNRHFNKYMFLHFTIVLNKLPQPKWPQGPYGEITDPRRK